MNYFIKNTESCNTLTTINTVTQLKYAAKKKDVIYILYLIIIIRTTTSETNSQSIDILTTT